MIQSLINFDYLRNYCNLDTWLSGAVIFLYFITNFREDKKENPIDSRRVS